MVTVLAKLGWALMRPGTLILVVGAAGLVLQLWPATRTWGRALAAAALIALLAIALLPLDRWLLRPLEQRFPLHEPAADPRPVAGIIVLGGSTELLDTGPDPAAAQRLAPHMLGEGADRLTVFAELARRHPDAQLIFTGGWGTLIADGPSEADLARVILAGLGLPPDRVLFEGASRNTWENATFSQALAAPAPGARWLLITSAFHMPRAVGCFRRIGWAVEAVPTDFRPAPLLALEPVARLGRFELALREWTALAAYHALGRTPTLWPAP